MRTLLQTFFAISSCYSFVRSSTNSTPQIQSECLFSLTDQTVKDKIQIFVAQSKKQIFLHFKLPGIEHLKTNCKIYRPLDIVCTNGSHSKEMLLLHPQFEEFSVGVLKFGVEHVDVPLVGIPFSCFSGMTENDLQNRLFSFIFTQLGMLEAGNEKARVCNQHLEENDGYADIYYKCCFPDTSGDFVCEKNTPNEWFIVLTVAVYIIYLLVVACSPLLIPAFWYQESKYQTYMIKTEKPFIFKANTRALKDATGKTKRLNGEQLDLGDDSTDICVKVNSVTINTQKLKPVTTDRLPIGLFHSLFKTILTSKMEGICKKRISDKTANQKVPEISVANPTNAERSESSAANPTNAERTENSDADPKNADKTKQGHANPTNPVKKESGDAKKSNSATQSMGECFKLIKHFAVLFVCLMPFLVRLLFFYVFEEEERTNREHFASNQNLSYPLGIKWNVTYSLQSDHPFFIVCYVAVMFIPFVRQFIKVVISSFDDVANQVDQRKKEVDKKEDQEQIQESSEVHKEQIQAKCTSFLALVKFSYSIVTFIPIVKLCLILFVGLIKLTWQQMNKIKDKMSKMTFLKWALLLPYCLFLIIINILMVIPMFSYLVLCCEVMIFVIQLLLYVFIGLVLNTTHVLTYISFGIWVIFYGGVFVKTIRSKYRSFCQKCIEHFRSGLSNAINNELLTSDKKCKPNYAFPLFTSMKDLKLSLNKYDTVILETEIPFLYFENDTPFISEDFFMKLCNLHCVGAPGSSSENNKKAVVNYIQIVLFLALVTIVVLAFGEASGITGTYQAVVALGGGLIPLLLKKFSSSSSNDEPIDFSKAFSFNDITTNNLDGSTRWEISYLKLDKDTDSSTRKHNVANLDTDSPAQTNDPTASNATSNAEIIAKTGGSSTHDTDSNAKSDHRLTIDIPKDKDKYPGSLLCSEIYICPMCSKTEYCKVPICNDTPSTSSSDQTGIQEP